MIMNNAHFTSGFISGFFAGLFFTTAIIYLINDAFKSTAVNQYISGELKCVPDAFEPETLICRSNVGK